MEEAPDNEYCHPTICISRSRTLWGFIHGRDKNKKSQEDYHPISFIPRHVIRIWLSAWQCHPNSFHCYLDSCIDKSWGWSPTPSIYDAAKVTATLLRPNYSVQCYRPLSSKWINIHISVWVQSVLPRENVHASISFSFLLFPSHS